MGIRVDQRPGKDGERKTIRVWVGCYHTTAVEHVTGATFAGEAASAKRNEKDIG